jgi:hypothetical protein
VARIGGEGDRKGNKVVIRDLEGCYNEISRRTASSKDEVKRIAFLVSWRGVGKGKAWGGKKGKEGKKEV